MKPLEFLLPLVLRSLGHYVERDRLFLTSLTFYADDLGSFDPQLERSYESILAASPEVSNPFLSTLSLLLFEGKGAFNLEGSFGVRYPGHVEAAFWKPYLYFESASQNSSGHRARDSLDCLSSLRRLMCRTLITCACLLTAHRMPLLPRIEESLLTRWSIRNSWDGKSARLSQSLDSHGFETLSFLFLLCFSTLFLSVGFVRTSAFR